MLQMKLSEEGIKNPEKHRQEQQAEKYPVDYCLKQIKEEPWLWTCAHGENIKTTTR